MSRRFRPRPLLDDTCGNCVFKATDTVATMRLSNLRIPSVDRRVTRDRRRSY